MAGRSTPARHSAVKASDIAVAKPGAEAIDYKWT